MDTGATLRTKGCSLVRSNGKLPVILQAERSECALACLAMILSYYGHKIDLNLLRARHRVSGHGITLKAVVNLASRLQLAVRPLRLDLQDLGKLAMPAMLHWDLDHFVILNKVTRTHLEIHNPAAGKQKITWHESSKHFTGVALELLPATGFKQIDERKKLPLRELWIHSGGLTSGLIQLIVLSLLLQLFAIALPFYTQILLDDVLVNFDVDLLKLLACGFLLVTVFRQLTELVRAQVVLYLSNKVSFQFATRLCSHLLHLPLEYFSSRHIGDIVSRFGSLNNVRDFLCSGIVQIFIDGLMVVGTLLLMFVYDAMLSTIALVAVILYGFLRVVTYQHMHARNAEWIRDRALENTVFMENVSVMQGIKLFGREASRLGSWQNAYATALKSGMKVQKIGITVQFFHGLLVGVENILLLLVGCYAVLGGSLSIGMLMAFISFKDHFYRSMFSLLDKLFEFKLLDIHLERLADIAFTEPEPYTEQCLIDARPKEAVELSLQEIAYAYDEGSPLLFQNVTLDLKSKEVIAIVGPTGCGKSTLLKIVLSLVKPSQGRIILNGKSIDQHGLEGYRALVSGVLQNDCLLSGSILENITFFDTTPDVEKAKMAATEAMLMDEIALMPMQFNTMVGSMGNALSGGQVQRVLLARALYQQPALLVLDEATSHLDVLTERALNNSLRKLELSCLMVAHRPDSVLGADKIFLLTSRGLKPLSHQLFRAMISNPLNDDVIMT